MLSSLNNVIDVKDLGCLVHRESFFTCTYFRDNSHAMQLTPLRCKSISFNMFTYFKLCNHHPLILEQFHSKKAVFISDYSLFPHNPPLPCPPILPPCSPRQPLIFLCLHFCLFPEIPHKWNHTLCSFWFLAPFFFDYVCVCLCVFNFSQLIMIQVIWRWGLGNMSSPLRSMVMHACYKYGGDWQWQGVEGRACLF